MKKEVIILAKSLKLNGCCIAGIEKETGNWIRPVSNALRGEIPYYDAILKGINLEVAPLDSVIIDFIKYNPTDVQKENYLYNSNFTWEKIEKVLLSDVLRRHGYDKVEYIFDDTNNYITEINSGRSLLLLKVNEPKIFIKTFKKQTIQLNFKYRNREYKYFRITDPEVRRVYSSYKDGTYPLDKEVVVVFSLTNKWEDGKYYKLVAKIF